MTFRVGEQAVEATRNVAQMKRDGRCPEWRGVEIAVAEFGGPLINVFLGELEGVKDGAVNGGQFGVGAAEPGFGLWGCCYGVVMATIPSSLEILARPRQGRDAGRRRLRS